MKITKIILEKWGIWMRVPVATNEWCLSGGREGLMYYDGECMNFWYALNREWYRMQNRKFARSGNHEPYEEPRDFSDFPSSSNQLTRK